MSDLCLNRGIEINSEILDSAKTKIGQVKVIGPSYLVVGVRLRWIRWIYWIRYLDCRHISQSGDGLVNISVTGSEGLSKSKPTDSKVFDGKRVTLTRPSNTFSKRRNCGMSDSGVELDIQIGDHVVDLAGNTVARVKEIDPDHLSI